MIINVQFKDKKYGIFTGSKYSYRCDIPGVQVGDILIAPTVRGDSEVRVCAIQVPESSIRTNILPLLKTITKRKEDVTDGK